MTHEEHERERRHAWDMYCSATQADPEDFETIEKEARYWAQLADAKLAERDKRFGRQLSVQAAYDAIEYLDAGDHAAARGVLSRALEPVDGVARKERVDG